MKTKCMRTIGFSILLWAIIFTLVSVLMFIPGLQGHDMWQFFIFLIALIPIVMLLAKWYFRVVMPNAKEGFLLGIKAVILGTILDMVITVPFFVKSYSEFYSDVTLYIGFVFTIVLTTYAGFEFDRTYTAAAEE